MRTFSSGKERPIQAYFSQNKEISGRIRRLTLKEEKDVCLN
jgi:hypothetical protein